MGRANTKKPKMPSLAKKAPFRSRPADAVASAMKPHIHIFGKRGICDTDTRGHPTPGGRSPLDLLINAPGGVIPLWARGATLRWRFQEQSLIWFEDPDAAKTEIKDLLGEALLAWDDAVPIQFANRVDAWDFEIVTRDADRCSANGCVLASAFFPDAGRHELILYPAMWSQSRKEQVDTLIHEIGHVFGLRHFFADIRETAWPSEVFGTHSPFSIMNYGSQSELTETDKADLRRLYDTAWSGELTEINGTPIQLVVPFSALGGPIDESVAACTRPAGSRKKLQPPQVLAYRAARC